MSRKNLLIVTVLFLSYHSIFSQRNYDDYNRIGVIGGLTLFDITTSNFETEMGQGFQGGFTTRGAFRNDFDLIYGLSFFSNSVGIKGNSSADTQFIDYKIQGVQIGFLGSYNIVKHHLSVEFGPILNVNSKLKIDSERYLGYILDGYDTLKAEDIQDISKVNFLVAGGLTGGFQSVRLSAMYQYGVTNMLNKLNSENLEEANFKGHSSTYVFSVIAYF